MNTNDGVGELRVPKQRAAVEVLSPDGKWRTYELFLAPRERIADLLEEREFMPARETDGAVAMLARASISAVRAEVLFEPVEELPVERTRQHVEVVLACGKRVQGVLAFEAPEAQARVIDHLNGKSLFFEVEQDGAIALVNKRHVVRVELR